MNASLSPDPAARPADRVKPNQRLTSGNDHDRSATVPLQRSGNPRPVRARSLHRQLSTRDLGILRSLADFRLMTGQQLGRLHVQSQSVATAARRRRGLLKRLTNLGAVQRLERRIGGIRAGSDGQIFALSGLGQAVLRAGDPDAVPRGSRLIGDTAPGFQDHLLAIAELYVALVERHRAGQVELLAFQTEPAAWRWFVGPTGERLPLKPDAFVRLGSGDYEQAAFVEVDCATESLPTLQRKCRRYLDYWQSGVEQAAHGVFPRVWWLVPGTRRETRLRELVASFTANEQALFAVGQLADGPGLLSAADDTLTGEPS